jgi:hypothetical protein
MLGPPPIGGKVSWEVIKQPHQISGVVEKTMVGTCDSCLIFSLHCKVLLNFLSDQPPKISMLQFQM